MKIVVVCGAGVGTSAMLAVNVGRVLQRLDVEADVVASSAMTLAADADDAQVVLATREWADRARTTGWADVIEIDSIFDLDELESKLSAALL